jgi:hypothetical protein
MSITRYGSTDVPVLSIFAGAVGRPAA